MSRHAETDKVVVYRLSTETNDDPFYIGSTNDLIRRLHEHWKHRTWWDSTGLVVAVVSEPCPRAEGERMEVGLIRHHRPRFNCRGIGKHKLREGLRDPKALSSEALVMVPLDDVEYEALKAKAVQADLTLAQFVRRVLHEAAVVDD